MAAVPAIISIAAVLRDGAGQTWSPVAARSAYYLQQDTGTQLSPHGSIPTVKCDHYQNVLQVREHTWLTTFFSL